MKTNEITYVNNMILGYFDNGQYKQYSKEEKEHLLDNICQNIKIKDRNRKLCSLLIGVLLLVIALTIMFLMIFNVISLGAGQWFNYTFVLLGLVCLWVLLYFISGFIFYQKEIINFHFKGYGNAATGYQDTTYAKWIERYRDYLGKVSFTPLDNPKKIITYALCIPSPYKNLIFNGKIKSNIPYYYMSYKDVRYLFLPGMIIIVNKNESKVLPINEISIKKDGFEYHLIYQNKDLLSFKTNIDFDINFFYFKY